MGKKNITALILAAGYSSRLGEFKPLLRLGEKTLWEWTSELFRRAGIGDIRVVVGHRAEELIPWLEREKPSWVLNPNYHQGMFSSVLTGVETIEKDCEAFFVLPVDIPLVRPQTIRALVAAYREGRGSIVYPVFSGTRGHPPLISTAHVEALRGYSGLGGLRGFLNAQGERAIEVEVADEGILLDVDTRCDYEKLAAKCERRGIPTVTECLELLRTHTKPGSGVVEHSVKVTQVSLCLARALNHAGFRMDMEVVTAAGLLHDVARGDPRHAEAGAELLRSLGYPEVAEVVSAHMDITVEEKGVVSLQELLYLADKLVEGNKVIALKERLHEKLCRYGRDPEARQALSARMTSARRIKEKIEAYIRQPLSAILAETLGEAPHGEVDDLLGTAR